MFDRDSLYNYVWRTLRDEIGDNTKTDYLTDRICDTVADWVPKQGDFWLNESDGMLYVNRGWEVVTAEAPEPADWLEVALEGIEKYGDALEEMK
jgi:hypothetical protein